MTNEADRATEKQLRFIRALLENIIWTDEERARGLADLDRLTKEQASQRIDAIQREMLRWRLEAMRGLWDGAKLF